jgi:anti-sigma factor RsiW
MNCRRASSLLSALIDGELCGVESLRIREHLEECRGCRDDYESLLGTKRIISSLSMVEPRREFEADLRECICRASSAPALGRLLSRWPVMSQRSRLRAASALAAGSVIVLAVSVRLTVLRGQTPAASRQVVAGAALPAPPADLPYPDIGFAHETFDRPQPVSYRASAYGGEPADRPDIRPLPAWHSYRPASSSR